MIHSVYELQGYAIRATDGEIGSAQYCLFDDQHWTVRYLVVDTGGWLSGRRVLISPIFIRAVNQNDQIIEVSLNRQQVENSPGVETEMTVSRQKEIEFARYYGYDPYWEGPSIWGAGAYPGMLYPAAAPAPVTPLSPPTSPTAPGQQPTEDQIPSAPNAPAPVSESTDDHGDPHLRSTHEVIGYAIQASDGGIGHVEDFLVDDETWTLRYMVIDTKDWLPGKKVLVAPRWVSTVEWASSRVYVDLPRETIKGAPEYDPSQPLNRDYESKLHRYYEQPTYWEAPHA